MTKGFRRRPIVYYPQYYLDRSHRFECMFEPYHEGALFFSKTDLELGFCSHTYTHLLSGLGAACMETQNGKKGGLVGFLKEREELLHGACAQHYIMNITSSAFGFWKRCDHSKSLLSKPRA